MDYNFKSSQAFITETNIASYQTGPLSGLTFAVKDLIDIAGLVTGCGNPAWAKTHTKAVANAICVDQLLSAGARCLGKTITDELAFSLIGENFFYGAPVNPKAPDRVPGGSSSGSAAAVACGLVDFALGTDTGGSVRVPASNCGIWGYRPSHDRITLAGVNPLALSFDTVGVFANNATLLCQVASVLLNSSCLEKPAAIKLFLLEDMTAICDAEIITVLNPIFATLKKQFSLEKINLSHILGETIDYQWLNETFRSLQWTEIWSCLGNWVTDHQLELSPIGAYNFNLAKNAARDNIQSYLQKRELFAKKVTQFLQPGCFLLLPTTPALAPKLNTIGKDINARVTSNYYPRTSALNTIAGLARLPQISMPFAQVDHVPIGFSLIGGHWQDEYLLSTTLAIGNYLQSLA